MENIITAIEKSRENKKSLVIKNAYKIIMAKVVKVLYIINLYNKYNCIINNIDINIIRDLGLTSIKNTGNLLAKFKKK